MRIIQKYKHRQYLYFSANNIFGIPYCPTPANFSPAIVCRIFQSCIFQSRIFSALTTNTAVTFDGCRTACSVPHRHWAVL